MINVFITYGLFSFEQLLYRIFYHTIPRERHISKTKYIRSVYYSIPTSITFGMIIAVISLAISDALRG